MGNVSTTAAEMQPVTDLPLEKVNECAKYYFDNARDHASTPPIFVFVANFISRSIVDRTWILD